MAKQIMEHEEPAPPKKFNCRQPCDSEPEQQTWFYRAVMKLYALLCGDGIEDVKNPNACLEAVRRFETLMSGAGYEGAQVVNAKDTNGQDCLPPIVESVVEYSLKNEESRIFPTRFWSSEETKGDKNGDYEAIAARLMERFGKIIDADVESWLKGIGY
jgi:hypothetical protein